MLTDRKIIQKLQRIQDRYAALRFEKVADVAMELAETKEHFRSVPTARSGLAWRAAGSGMAWGDSWVTGWFRGRARLPAGCEGKKVFIRARTGAPETMLLVDGAPQGVFDGNHRALRLAQRGRGGKTYRLALEAYCKHTFPGTQPHDTPHVVAKGSCVFEGVELLLERQDVTAFVFDLAVLRQLQEALSDRALRGHRIAAALGEVYDAVIAMPSSSSEAQWRPGLAVARKIMAPLLARRNGPTTPHIGLVGHSHLDTAWLWPLAETWRKAARTFSSMLSLMEQYPEVTFVQPAPCHADVMRKEYPGLFRRMQKMARTGRWEINGAMWVEPDCNLPGGEAFVRQLLVGQSASRDMFGRTSDTLWLPDVFGYSAALPQILRGCGVEFFCTTKIAWNDTTRFPYDTFEWRGIDGTSVLSHFNAIHCWPDPKTLLGQWDWVQHKDVQDRRLCAYGYGDGGGGPQAEMMEIARRLGDLEGCPTTAHTTVSEFMNSVRDEMTNLPVWVGELYLELHRGTLTSIAKVKRGNRKAEIALRQAELLATMASLRGAKYPAATLLEIWKEVLTNQFHDILPGSSIAEVNDEAVASYRSCIARCDQIAAKSAAALLGRPGQKSLRRAVVNSLSWDYDGEIVLRDTGASCRPADREVPAQRIEDPAGRKALVIAGLPVPALGAAVVELARGTPGGASPFVVRGNTVRTPHATVRFDKAGRIVSFVDKASGRQIVRPGGALNALLAGEDVPLGWDNWDIDADQEAKLAPQLELESRTVVADGPLQLRVRGVHRIGRGSVLTQDVVFHAGDPRVDFETVVDWNEKHQLLKASFELALLADFARHEIQYGHVERPTHRNYPADRARFEVCAHKWTDLSENGFGVALLNDGKYGVSVHGGTLGLTLLKSGLHPDDRGDRGVHEMTYSLRPHAGGFSVESVLRPAYELNMPPVAYPAAKAAGPIPSLVTVDAANVIVESVKWAESGKAMVVRLYEAGKTGTAATVRLAPAVRGVCETNMLEQAPRALPLRRGRVKTYFRPFEIKTLRCEL